MTKQRKDSAADGPAAPDDRERAAALARPSERDRDRRHDPDREIDGDEIDRDHRHDPDRPHDRRHDLDHHGDHRHDPDRDPLNEGTRDLVAALDRIELADRGSEEFFDPVEPADEEPEAWFDAEALAAASTVVLGESARDQSFEAGLLVHGPSRAEFTTLASAPALSLEQLPGWPGAGPCGQGWGPTIATWLAPIRPGFVLAITGAELESPRRAWIAQLADGLAMRDEPGRPLTPVIRLSEESALHQRVRLLGRFLDLPPRRLLSGSFERDRRTEVDRIWQAGEQRLRLGLPYLWSDPLVRPRLISTIERWRRRLIERERAARSIWPVLILDDLAAFAGDPGTHVRELAELAEQHGLIVLLGADRQLDDGKDDRWLDARLILHPHKDRLEVELAHCRLATPARTRLGYRAASGRFEWLADG